MATIVTIDGAPKGLGFAESSAPKQKTKIPVPGRPGCFCFDNPRTKRRGWACRVPKDPTRVASGMNRTGVRIQKGLCPISPR